MSSNIAQSFCRNNLISQLITYKVLLSQSQKVVIRNLIPIQSSLLRSYTNSTFSSPSSQKDSTSFSYPNKFTKAIVKQLSATIIAKFVIAGVVTFISGDLFYAWYINRCNELLLNKTVEEGTRPDVKISEDKLIPRPKIIEHFKKILQPDKYQSQYYMICGEHGTGKTTLTRIAAREAGQDKDKDVQGGMGIIYVEVPADLENIDDFGIAFGKSLNFAFQKYISYSAQAIQKILGYTYDKDKRLKWKRALEAFKHAGSIYKAKYDKPPVIIFDNIDKLVNLYPNVLHILQDEAKMNVDSRNYVTVFVSSEDSVPRIMESRSSWSRAKKPVIEISDLNKEESIEYLVKKCNINKIDSEKLYNLVGGRILDLITVANNFIAGKSIEVIKQQILDEVEKKFQSAKLLPKSSHYKIGKIIIKDLLKSKELSFLEFENYFNNTEELNEILGSNIFAYHPEKNIITFQSRSVEYYIWEKSYLFRIHSLYFKNFQSNL